ncbi:MAG: hypothetical protein KGJ46_03790 [Xanthomonadaceae bacterium]|nr:hypothetical protein [Xanthomonadaceae bacterium]
MSDAGDAASPGNEGGARQPDRHSGLALVLPAVNAIQRLQPAAPEGGTGPILQVVRLP